ncbi:hypothetical protein [Methylobacterium sp. J-070]|uniref:hypothetical protein n=1 Tax=Methylobacterium sp. J-070 TaxID=2836650 RepID=UPI001FBA7D2C|nr:hypothetical protein [Methylobacterium sp. J-070]MCJ2051831.1 hypothetical protein [Methylobacterium sp. J-070]
MSKNIEAEVRLLVQRVAERATQGGGLDRETYDALTAASAALSALALAVEHEGREEALRTMLARLRACEAEPYDKAA